MFLITSRAEGNDQQPWDTLYNSAPRDKIAVSISMSAQWFLEGGEEKEKTNGNSVKGVLTFC